MATLLYKSAPGESAADPLRDADPGRGALRSRRLTATARNIGLVLGGQAGLSASRFAALLLVSHWVAPTRFDECAIYASSSLVVGNLCELGINISCLKFAAGATGPDWLRTVSRFLLLRLALTAGVIAAIFLLAPLAGAKLLRHPEYETAIRLACGSAAVASISSFTLVLLQSRLEFARMARLSAVAAILQILPVLLVLRGGFSGLASLFAGDVLSRLWIVAANLSLLASVLAAAHRQGTRPAWKPIAVFANWITLSTVIGSLYNYIPSIALSRWAAASALGAYTLGMSLTGGFALLINTTSTVLLPEAVAATTPERRRNYLRSYMPGAALLAMALFVPTWLGGPLAAHLFPAAMPGAVRVFQLLATAHIALLVANPVQFLLYGAGHPEWCTASDALITLLFGAMAVWLAPTYGAVGVAWALLIAQTGVKAGLATGLGTADWGLGAR
ncbi:MAG TPA: oligosaccharide flippase family protein [Bryobacteraceae bacterium]|nr:oligosaccharide flippase family protein [Bryobacteraceae bacterium]